MMCLHLCKASAADCLFSPCLVNSTTDKGNRDNTCAHGGGMCMLMDVQVHWSVVLSNQNVN
jgi:hypothetical protein